MEKLGVDFDGIAWLRAQVGIRSSEGCDCEEAALRDGPDGDGGIENDL